MAITIIQARKKQRYLILAAALIIFLTIFVIWQGFFRGEKLEEPLPSAQSAIYVLPKIDIDWKFLENFNIGLPFQPFVEISVFSGEFGRENPFVPY